MAQPETIQRILIDMSGNDEKTRLNAFRELFWTELNYERADQSIPTNEWTPKQKAELLELSRFAYYESQFGRFEIIFCRLKKLSRITEREVITKLLASYPYALFVFSDPTRDTWHFVNVKYSKDANARRLLRRITVGAHEQLRTASERIALLDISSLALDMFGLSPLTIQERHDLAFDVEAVTKAFYRDYEAVFSKAEKQIHGLGDEESRLFTQRLFNRLMFIRFLERKGWLTFRNSGDYLQALWSDYIKNKQPGDNFYTSRLTLLFFAGLNNTTEVDIMGINQGGILKDLIGAVPYLNGGLFEEIGSDRSDGVIVPDEVLKPVVEAENGLFYRYNFTVTESTPFDVEVAVDPEMLGKIFEELVTGRHESGSYYTPKVIVSFMGREAIRNYLQVQCPQEPGAAISAFIDNQDAKQLLDPESVLNALKRIKICDPACGSGAYLLGMMQELLELRRNLFVARPLDTTSVYRRKLEIIQSNLYGVDIDQFAVNITRLRLWLSLIVDFDGPKPLPLPNLDYKVEVGNSLTAPDPMPTNTTGILRQLGFRSHDLDVFRDLKSRYIDAHGEEKRTLHEEIERLRETIREWMKSDRKLKHIDGFDWAVEFSEVFTEGGFDMVVANPPYVRQELIKAQKPALKSVYGDRFAGTADLFVYFYFRALQLLRSNGVLAFISSNKWMRAGYGEKLRETLRTQTTVKNLIDFGDLPLFGAIAYPCVIVARRTTPHADHQMKALTVDNLSIIDQLVDEVEENGWQQPQNSLDNDGWTLMKPELLALLEKLKKNGTTLEKYVKGYSHYGIKTGLSEAFMIDGTTRSRLIAEDPKSEEVIKPWLRGRDIKRWHAQWDNSYVIFTRQGIDIEKYPAIKKYLSQFKKRLTPGISGGRKPGSYKWYEIQDNVAYYAEFEKPKIIYQTFQVKPVFAIDTTGFYVNNAVWIIALEDYFLLGCLNSKLGWYEISRNCTPVQNGYQLIWDYFKKVIIPQPPASLRKQIAEIARQCTEATNISDLGALEARLDALVYLAYDLSNTEIALIAEAPQAISQIQAEHPDKWLAIEVTEHNNETNEPIKGYLRAIGETQTDIFSAAAPYKGKSLYVFFNEAQEETTIDET